MFCHGCGTQVSPELQFCPNCGQPLGAAALSTPPAVIWVPPVGVKAMPGAWIGAGWEMVKADIGTYMLLSFVLAALSAMVPIVIQGPLLVGFHIFCIKKLLGKQAEFGDLFKGFNFFVPALVASLLISLFSSIGLLLCIVGALVVGAMYKFTYLVILDKRMDFWPAMQASHAVVKNDYFGFTMFLLLIALVDLLGVLCCIVGVFIAIPVGMAAITVAYRDLVGFDQQTIDAL